jgi:NAD+ kinase
MPSGEPIRRAAVLTHGRPEVIGPALDRLSAIAEEARVELLFPEEEAKKHGVETTGELAGAQLAIVLGGDGTMLRALHRFLGTGIPALGVNFGRVGFLASITREQLEEGVCRALAGEFRVVPLPTVEVDLDGRQATAVNDVVAASSVIGRMVELEWSIGGEDLGRLPCDGLICASPSGSTAYNLSNGGPVLVWGLDAMAITFIAPHSLHARPLVVPRDLELVVQNETPDVPVVVLTDGHPLGEVPPGGRAAVRLGPQSSLLATMPESTFFRRYRETFAS